MILRLTAVLCIVLLTGTAIAEEKPALKNQKD